MSSTMGTGKMSSAFKEWTYMMGERLPGQPGKGRGIVEPGQN